MFWVISLLLSLTSYEQAVVSQISGSRMMKDLQYITQFDRISGGEGEAKSVDYIVERLKEAGIPLKVHEFDSLLSWPGQAGLELLAPEQRNIGAITFSFGKSTPSQGVTGEIVAATVEGGMVRQPETLKGKIVFMDALPSPGGFLQIERAGAIGAIFNSTADRFNEMIATTVWGTPSTANAKLIPNLPGITLKKSDGAYLKSAIAKGAVRGRIKASVDTKLRRVRIPVANVEGRDADHFVLLASHIDAWHRGGTDAGASNIIGLEMARAFQHLKERGELQRSIRIAWWPGHSTGRYSGSTWYADNLFTELDRGAIAHVNMDGLGSRGGRIYSTQNTAEFDALAADVLRDAVQAQGRVARPNRNSDQSFLGIGIPSLQIDDSVPEEAGGYWWWHTVEDTYDKADENIMVRDASAVAVALSRLIQSPILPYRFSDVTKQIEARIREYQQQAGNRFSLERALQASRDADSAIKQLEQKLASGNLPSDRLRAINDGLMQISRLLNPVVYTESGRYHPDDANNKVLIPGLAGAARLANLRGDQLLFEETYLTRERNRLVDALHRTAATARSLL